MKAVDAGKIYGNYIGGQWLKSSRGELYGNTNPARPTETMPLFQRSTSMDVDLAVEAAAEALEGWAATPAPRRGLLLFEAWVRLRERAEEFAVALSQETGKTITDARGEIRRALNVLEFMAGEGRRFAGQTIPSELSNNFIFTRRRPIGVVSVITPWNFPVAIPMWKITPALVCGNSIVFKPATTTPLCATKIVELFAEVGLPRGALNLVTGAGPELGERLVTHPKVRGVSFTGSSEVGSNIYAAASRGLKRVQCEMGGKNALVVMPDANLDLAVEAVVQGAYGFCGQRCTATSRVIVHEGVKDSFLDALVARAGSLRVGDPMDSEVDMGPLASQAQLDKVLEYVEIGKREGALLVYGGSRIRVRGFEDGYFVGPTIFDEVRPGMRIAREEIFGPVLAVLICRDLQQAIGIVNDSDYGFKAALYTANISDILHFIDAVDVAMVHINAPTLGGEVQAPFGGRKNSGAGMKEQGRAAIDFFSEEQIVTVDNAGAKREAEPPSKK